ncbi:MAG: flagellar protein FliT, partial [Gammaproteobacteria bacterium]
DWARANELQADCHGRAEALLAQPVSETSVAAIANGISELMEMHAEVMRLCVAARDYSLQEIDSLNHGRQAVSEYSANSG